MNKSLSIYKLSRFDRLLRGLISVPKSELEAEERKYEREQAKKKDQRKPRKPKK